MPDITKCVNEKCKLRKECWRFMCEPDRNWQSCSEFKPNKNGTCEHFWEMPGEEKKAVKKKKAVRNDKTRQ